MREPIFADLAAAVEIERRPLGRPAILRSMEQLLYDHKMEWKGGLTEAGQDRRTKDS
jgi:hypothetical protein